MKEYPVNPQILLLHNKYNDSLVICYEWCWSSDNISDKKNKTFSSDHIKKCPLRFNDFWVKNVQAIGLAISNTIHPNLELENQ